MIVHQYPALFAGTEREVQARRVASRTRELTQFLIDDLDSDLAADCGGCTVAFHHSCHGLRGLGLSGQADRLLREVDRVPLEGAEECCGFGGLFSVEMASVSAAIMDEKLDRVEASRAETLVGSDISCLIHLEGGLRRRGSAIRVRHIAELLGPSER
jgi:L-lactate dehydrogenase complex protein LldE